MESCIETHHFNTPILHHSIPVARLACEIILSGPQDISAIC